MTTRVRIEKADAGVVALMVQEQAVDQQGHWVNYGEPKALQYPAQLFEDHVHQNKRFIVSELRLG